MKKTAVYKLIEGQQHILANFRLNAEQQEQLTQLYNECFKLQKQQIIDAYINGIRLNLLLSDCMSHEDIVGYANKFYNKTFNN